MGAAGTSVPRPGVLDPCQGFPQLIRLNVRGKVIQNSTINLFLSCAGTVLFQFYHQSFRSGDKSLMDYFPSSKVSSSNSFFTLS